MDQPDLILTPTSRLARVQLLAFAEAQRSAGCSAWRAPAILSFSAWLSQLQEEALLFGDLHDAPNLLPASRAQAAWLWQAVVDPEVFIGSPRVAELAQRAWQTLHDYELPSPERWPTLALSEDSRQFQRWAERYERRLRELKLMDEAQFAQRLPEAIAAGQVDLPARIELRGFDLPPTPLMQRILATCVDAGSTVSGVSSPTTGASALVDAIAATNPPPLARFVDADSELRAAAHWARQRLEDQPQLQLAIVVSDLAGRIDAVDRQLREVFAAPSLLLLEGGGEDPWHLSLGKPLADWPLVNSALNLLQLNPRRLSQPQLHGLAQSAFLPRLSHDGTAGALARLARDAPYWLTLEEWLFALAPADAESTSPDDSTAPSGMGSDDSQRIQALRGWQAQWEAAPETAWPSRWAQQFQEELTAIGFGHGRTLSSREYQTLERWHDLLEDFAHLDTILDQPLTRFAALAELRVRATTAVFRERNAGARLEVLGIQEALGARFDGLWITGLDALGWPGAVRREPLLPSIYQRDLPGATSDGCLEQARLELAALLHVAPELQLSFAVGTDDAAIAPTALLPAPETAAPGPGRSVRDWLLWDDSAAAALPQTGTELDRSAPPVADPIAADGTVSGGTGILSSQSACPFQAFARYRLRAQELRIPRPGLSPQERGQLAHSALEQLFRAIPAQSELCAQTAEQRASAVREAVARTLGRESQRYRYRFTTSSQELERRRLERLLLSWIEQVELPRPAFTVEATEHPLELTIGRLKLRGQIDRIDRLDDDGARVLIDYKSSAPSKSQLQPNDRIREPQLPAYALSLDPPPAAVAFGSLAPAKPGYVGYGAPGTALPGIEELDGSKAPRGSAGEALDWATIQGLWADNLKQLADDYLAGSAAVDPREAAVCRHCHLSALCRISAARRDDSTDDSRDGAGARTGADAGEDSA